jgi:hypothetical protein
MTGGLAVISMAMLGCSPVCASSHGGTRARGLWVFFFYSSVVRRSAAVKKKIV